MEFDFATNQTVDSLDKVPTDFRGLYAAVEGQENQFKLGSDNPAIASAVSAITGLNTALKSSRAQLKAKGTVDLTVLKEFGETPEAIKTAVDLKLNGLNEQIKGVNVTKIKQDLQTEWSGKLTAAETATKALELQLHDELVSSRAISAIAAEDGEPELLLPVIAKSVKAAVVNGKYTVNVVDGAGDIRYSGTTGAPMSIAELVKETKANAKFGVAFKSKAANGGGAQPGAAANKGAAGAAIQRQAADMSPSDKIAAGLAALSKR